MAKSVWNRSISGDKWDRFASGTRATAIAYWTFYVVVLFNLIISIPLGRWAYAGYSAVFLIGMHVARKRRVPDADKAPADAAV